MKKPFKENATVQTPETEGFTAQHSANDELATASQDEQRNPWPKGFPEGLVPHHRYLSEWSENKLTLALGHHSDPSRRIREFDLDKITLLSGGHGVYVGAVKLTQFPNFLNTLKAAMNRALETYHKGKLDNELPTLLNRCCTVFSYLLRQGFYSLRECPSGKLKDFSKRVAEESLLGALDFENGLRKFSKQLSSEQMSKLIGKSNLAQVGINTEEFAQAFGIYVAPASIPRWFRRRIARANGVKPIVIKYEEAKPSRGELQSVMIAMNFLGMHPPEIDSFAFHPFPNLSEEMAKYFKDDGGQTFNIQPLQFAALTGTLLKWVLDYSPHILELVAEFRKGVTEVLEGKTTEYYLQKRIYSLHAQMVADNLLPGPQITMLNGPSEGSLQFLLRVEMIACGALIASNHARRANELYGYREPYGLYFGCLTLQEEELLEYTLDAYVLKGIQDYHAFPANTLVAGAVQVLETLYNLTRLHDEPEFAYFPDRTDGRHLRLFLSRMLTVDAFKASKRHEMRHRDYLPALLKEAGIDPASWHESQMPFRRHFVSLALRRYDLPEDTGVQRQLGHLDLNSTLLYGGDSAPRPAGQSVIELHGKAAQTSDNLAMLEAFEEGRRAYLEESVLRLFEGDFMGGIFARVILALVKRLSRDVNFSRLSVERKAAIAAEKLHKRGYRTDEMPHTVCTVGSARHARKAAKCNRGGQLHREEANLPTCSGCVNSWSNENYLHNSENERDRCWELANSEDTPPELREEYRIIAQELDILIKAELEIAEGTAALLESIVSSWNTMVLSASVDTVDAVGE